MNNIINKLATGNIRAIAVDMLKKANSGHAAGPMAGNDFIDILYIELPKGLL